MPKRPIILRSLLIVATPYVYMRISMRVDREFISILYVRVHIRIFTYTFCICVCTVDFLSLSLPLLPQTHTLFLYVSTRSSIHACINALIALMHGLFRALLLPFPPPLSPSLSRSLANLSSRGQVMWWLQLVGSLKL